MLSIDDFLDLHGADVTLYKKSYGAPDPDTGDRTISWTSKVVKCWIVPWASLQARIRWNIDIGGTWTSEDMVGMVKADVDVAEGEAYIDDGSKLWDVIEVFEVKILVLTQHKVLQLRRRKS